MVGRRRRKEEEVEDGKEEEECSEVCLCYHWSEI